MTGTGSKNDVTPDGRTIIFDRESLARYIDETFNPDVRVDLGEIISIDPGVVRMKLVAKPHMLRRGGIISGPHQMAFVDVAAFVVICAHAGPVGMAVTTNLNISFLRAARSGDLMCDAHLLKLGRRLATVETRLWQGTPDRLIGHATVSYALPG